MKTIGIRLLQFVEWINIFSNEFIKQNCVRQGIGHILKCYRNPIGQFRLFQDD